MVKSVYSPIDDSPRECPCQSGLSYSSCCEIFHLGLQHAETAEQLMRSRFCAFSLEKMDYLCQTWSKTTWPGLWESDKTRVWTGLNIISLKMGKKNDKKGKVHFIAYFLQNGEIGSLEEISRFKREFGVWVYVDGDILN